MTQEEQLFSRISDIHEAKGLGLNITPYGTDKLVYKSYLERLYPSLLVSCPEMQAIVEIGVRGGASIYLWSSLYPDASVTGVDLTRPGDTNGPNPAFLSNRNTTFLQGDAYTDSVAAKVPPTIDLIIDDGSHKLKDQLTLVGLYANKLSQRGVLVIEDIQRGYWHAFQILRNLPAREQFKITAHDYRFNKRAADDFAVSITRGRTSGWRLLYYLVRSGTFLFEHGIIKLLNSLFRRNSKVEAAL